MLRRSNKAPDPRKSRRGYASLVRSSPRRRGLANRSCTAEVGSSRLDRLGWTGPGPVTPFRLRAGDITARPRGCGEGIGAMDSQPRNTWFTIFMRITMLMILALPFAVVPMVATQAALDKDSFLMRNTTDLVELCSATRTDSMNVAAQNFCLGFTVAAFRMLWAEDMARRSDHLLCVPTPQPTRDQVLLNFLLWAKANPALMLRPATDGFRAFINSQYGCVRPR